MFINGTLLKLLLILNNYRISRSTIICQWIKTISKCFHLLFLQCEAFFMTQPISVLFLSSLSFPSNAPIASSAAYIIRSQHAMESSAPSDCEKCTLVHLIIIQSLHALCFCGTKVLD